MAPKRNNNNLTQISIWNEDELSLYLPQEKHRSRLWRHLILSFSDRISSMKHKSKTFEDLPLNEFKFPKSFHDSILGEKKVFQMFTTHISERRDSKNGNSTKLLIKLQDGHEVETVVMRHKGHATACVSSQIGCQMGCRFCATGTMGIIGDLQASEIIEQLVHANTITPIRNVVFMGMGEPLNNYENVKKAVSFMINSKRFALAPRHVTISTVGVLKYMKKLSEEMPFLSLAFSMHAPNQDVRVGIVPAAKAHKLTSLLEAVDYHIQKNREWHNEKNKNKIKEKEEKEKDDKEKEDVPSYIDNIVHDQSSNKAKFSRDTCIMIEYILIKDVNDKDEHAHELSQVLSSRKDHIFLNLIPYNPTEVAEDYYPPDDEQVQRFHQICSSEPYSLHTRVRQEKGQDIAGACGQLALVKKGELSYVGDVEDFNNKKLEISEEEMKIVKKNKNLSFYLSSLSLLTYVTLLSYKLLKK